MFRAGIPRLAVGSTPWSVRAARSFGFNGIGAGGEGRDGRRMCSLG